MDEFTHALATADEVVLAPIYGAREDPIAGVTSEVLAEKISALGTPAQAFSSLDDVYMYFTSTYKLEASHVVLTMGAGDIYKVAERLIEKS
jgi:UDP-N-acetylmuramate--alanine ligase